MSLPRSMYYYSSRRDDSQVINKLLELSDKRPSRGFDHYYGCIRNEGLVWNHKRVKRVYNLLGLNLKRKHKKRLPSRVKEPLLKTDRINQIWSMDFMTDALMSGRKVRLLNVMDDFNREVLGIEVDFSISGERVIRVLDQIIDWRGIPEEIRVDNGPEFLSGSFVNYCRTKNIRIRYIQPGKPVQNAYIERLNRTIREDILDAYLFEDISQLRILTEEWMEDYNNNYPLQPLHGKSPREYMLLTVENSERVSHN